MAILKHTTLYFKTLKNIYRKRYPGSSGPRETSNKYESIDSCSNMPTHDEAMLFHMDTNSNNNPSDGPVSCIPTLTLNDDEVPLVPSYSASSDPFVDKPDSVPLLDLSTFTSNAAALRTAIDTQCQEQTRLQTPASQPCRFRVIIVGGGPSGLALAHALHQAGIGYVVLERSRTILNPDNNDSTGLVLWPHASRILDQLGLLRRAQKLACPLLSKQTYRADGSSNPSTGHDVFARSRSDHGRRCMLIGRNALLGPLWEALPEREAHVRTGREVVSAETHAAGVRVTCADGSVEEGSVVVGCDGVHGVMRRIVCDLRAEKKRAVWRRRFSLGRLDDHTSRHDGKADRAMEARHYGLVGSAPLLDGLEPGVCYETRGDATGKTFQVLAGVDNAYFLVYIKLARPTHKQTSYTAQNADYLASALAEHPVTDKVKFGDLWQARHCGKMVDFHEGIAEKWYHERVVLVGDAAHSMTPALGLGVNTGWQGVAELANGLRRLLLLCNNCDGRGQGPDTAAIKRVFKAYQSNHDDMARRAVLISSFYTRAIADQSSRRSPMDSFYGWATPALAGDIALLERQAAWAVRLGITLEFLEERHFKEGKLRWVHPRRRADGTSAEEESRGQTVWLHPGIPVRVRAS